MVGLLEGLILLSIGVGVILLILRHNHRAETIERLAAVGIGLLSLPLLWPRWFPSAGWCLELFPGAGCARWEGQPPGNILAVITFIALAVVHGVRHKRASTGWPGLGHILCGLTAAGLTVDHMMMRYVLVEIVALVTLVLLVVGGVSGKSLWRDILFLRIAGGSFLLLVLALFILADSFAIIAVIAAAVAQPGTLLVPLLISGLVAVWVKLGLPPFQGWVHDALRARGIVSGLGAGVGLPLLGAYLLYRLSPLFAVMNWGAMFWVLGGLILLWAILARRTPIAIRLLGISSALLMALTTTPWLSVYLPIFALVRIGIILVPEFSPSMRSALAMDDSAMDGQPIASLEGLGPFMSWAHRLMDHVEIGSLEKMNRNMVLAAQSLAIGLQRQHVGLLRRNLLWACIGIVALVVLGLVISPIG